MKPALSSHIIINGEIFTEILDKDINNVKSGQYINESGVIYTPNSIYKFRYPVYGSNRYGRVRVYKNDGSCIMTTVHRLLMTVYIPIDNRDELVVNHINGNKHYNSLMNNLEWVTEKENAIHAINTGLTPIGENSAVSKLTEKEVEEICIELLKPREYGTINNLARKYNVSESVIRNIANGSNWRSVSSKFNLNYSQKGVESILTENQVIEICKELSRNKYRGQYTDLAKKYNASPSTIKQIAYRQSWKHISCNYDF